MMKELALFTYGHRLDIDTLKNNLKIFHQFMGEKYTVHVFILTTSRDVKREYYIKYLFSKYDYTVHFIKYIEDFTEQQKEEEVFLTKKFYSNLRTCHGVIGNNFIPLLLYRNFLINKYKNEYIEEKEIPIDIHVYLDLFNSKLMLDHDNFSEFRDDILSRFENKNCVFGCSDKMYIGSKKVIDYLFDHVNLMRHDFLFHEYIWRDPQFVYKYFSYDETTVNQTYLPAVQYYGRMSYSRELSIESIKYDDKPLVRIEKVVYNNEPCVDIKSFMEEVSFTVEEMVDYYKDKREIILTDVNTNDGSFVHEFNKQRRRSDDIISFDHVKRRNMTEKSVRYIIDNLDETYVLERYKNLLLASDVINIQQPKINSHSNDILLQWLKENNYMGLVNLMDDLQRNFDQSSSN